MIYRFKFTKQDDDVPRPLLLVKLKNIHTGDVMYVYGQIDTGADRCAIPSKYAFTLGHNLKAVKPKIIHTASGQTEGYEHTTAIDVLALDSIDEEILFSIPETKIDYIRNLNDVLLGVSNFLAKCTITINYPKEFFTIEI